MKKIILIISCILSLLSFSYFKEIRGKQQLNEMYSFSKQQENSLYSTVIAANDISEQQAQILVQEIYNIIDEFDVAVIVSLGNTFLDNRDYFLAGSQELTDLVIPYRYTPKNPIDFLDEKNNNQYYTNSKGNTSELYLLSSDEINIYQLNQLSQHNSLKVAYRFFSNNEIELKHAVSAIFEVSNSGLYSVELGISDVDYSSLIFDHSVSILLMVIILLFSILLIENLRQDKQILIRKLQGHSSLRVAIKINLQLILISLLGMMGTYIILFLKDNTPINEFTISLIGDCILLILMVCIGFLIIIFAITTLIKKYTISNHLKKGWMISEKIILVAVTIMIAISIVKYQQNIGSISFSMGLMNGNNKLEEKYTDYNFILSINGLTSKSSQSDNDIYDMTIAQLEERGMIFLPIFNNIITEEKRSPDNTSILYTKTPEGVLLETNYNYINELNLVNEDGKMIDLGNEDHGMIVDSSLKDHNLEELCNLKKIGKTSSCRIDYVDNLNLSYFSPTAMYMLAVFENEPAYVLEYNVGETRGSSRYITDLSENEIVEILNQSTLSLDAYTSTVKEYCDAENNSTSYNISKNIQAIFLMTLSILSLLYLYVELYTRINKKEFAIKNSLGQSVIRIHSDLIVYLCCSGTVLVFLSYFCYKTSNALWYFVAFIVTSFILCFIACVIKNNQRRIK